MDPITWIIIGSVLSSIVTTIVSEYRGYKMAVLGPKGCGKSSFYMSLGMLISGQGEPEATRSPERTEQGQCDILIGINRKSRKKIRFQASVDVPGNEKKYWKKEVEKANIIMYFIDAKKLKDNEDNMRNRVQQDLQDLQKWMDGSSEKKFFIIGSHFDKVSRKYRNAYDKHLEEFKQLLHPIDEKSKDYRHIATDIIIGSLAEVNGMQSIMAGVVSHLEKN